MTNNYKKNTNYNGKIYFWINKQIAFDKKISDYIFYKDLHKSRNNSPRKIYPANSEYKPKPKTYFNDIIKTYFNDIIENGCSGICRTYYSRGTLEKEYFHNNGEIEGEYKKYYENGSIKETCNYFNGLKHGKWIYYHKDGKIDNWETYYNDMHTFDWRYITILHVPKDFPQDKINMLCD